jgi:enediyne biosynthesis protein E4
MGLGAQVRITTDAGVQYNHATTSTGYACSSDPRVHFGLGASKVVKEIDITWPSRIHQTLRNVPADRILTITEKGLMAAAVGG